MAITASISSGDSDSRTLFLFEEVTSETTKPIIESILKFNDEDAKSDKKQKDFIREPIKLMINTPGGAVRDGFGLITAIDTSITPVHTYIYGMAASMGLAIAIAGHKRFGHKLTSWMYHSISGSAWGDIKTLGENVEEKKVLMNMYDQYIADKTSITKEHMDLVKAEKRDWHFKIEDALKLKVIDEAM